MPAKKSPAKDPLTAVRGNGACLAKPKSMRGRLKAELIGACNPVGRPRIKLSDLPRNWRAMMIEEATNGGGPTAIMVRLKIGVGALETLLRDEPEFSNTYSECLLLCKHWWETIGKDMASGVREKGNGGVWAMNMANRFGWNSQRNQVVGDREAPLAVEHSKRDLTREELIEELSKRGLPTSIFDT